jgi:hypothetical protein
MLLADKPSVVFEADENMNRMNVTTDDLFGFLGEAAPYSFFVIDKKGALLPAQPPYPFGNFLALSPRHSRRF